MTTINEYLDQLLDQSNQSSQEARSYGFNFQAAAVERIFEYDFIETQRCDLDERTHRDLVEQSIDFLFNEDWDIYETLREQGVSAEAAGRDFVDIRSGFGFLINDEITAAAKSYGDIDVH